MSEYTSEETTFTGWGGERADRHEETGWFLAEIKKVQTRDRDGQPLKTKNDKRYWRLVLAIVGGPSHGREHLEMIHLTAAFRIERFMRAIGYEIERDKQGRGQVDPDRFVGHQVVCHFGFQDNSEYLEVQPDEDNPKVPCVLSVDEANEYQDKQMIYCPNLNAEIPDASDDLDEAEEAF